jgi:polyadenylate-binding protein
MKYFEIRGKQCRALPFDKQLLGSNKDKLTNNNIFVKVPKDMRHEDLHKLFEQSGKIKSLKISLNADFSSRGYGFICFQEEQSAQGALQGQFGDEVLPMKFEPKDRRHFRRLINNIYVKNLPMDKSEQDITDMFKPFGHIKSLVVQQNEFGQFAFICFDDPNNTNKEYGPQCAQKAIDEMNDREMSPGIKLVVKHALKKAEREIEKVMDTIRYKASKKRCNLYVKNFPNQYTKDDLTNLFKTFGEIENIRLDKSQQTKNAFAFVCFKEPTDAAKAKSNLQNHSIEGKMLLINYYEIKEVRKLQMEEARDKADWEKYQAQQTGGLKWNDLTSQPHLAQMLQQLLGIIQYNEQTNQQMNQGGDMRQRRQHSNYQRGPRPIQNGNPHMQQQQQQ